MSCDIILELPLATYKKQTLIHKFIKKTRSKNLKRSSATEMVLKLCPHALINLNALGGWAGFGQKRNHIKIVKF